MIDVIKSSEPNHNLRVIIRSMTGISAPGFGYSSGYPSVIPSYNPTKYPSPETIVKASSVPSETTTKDS